MVIIGVLVLAVVTLFAVQNLKGGKGEEKKAGMSREKMQTRNPVLATEESIEAGKRVYDKHCKQCHGRDAIRNEKRCTAKFCPADLRHPRLWRDGDGFVYWTIMEGRTPMPRFRGKLVERQCWDVVNYLKSLHKGGEERGSE